jgi:hypothetical protein
MKRCGVLVGKACYLQHTIKNMLKGFILLVFASACSFCSVAQDTVAILANAKYITATEAEMKEAVQKTENLIKDIKASDKLFEKFLLIGGQLWQHLKDQPELKDADYTNVTFKLPVLDKAGNTISKVDIIGKAIQEIPDHQKVWNKIAAEFNLSKGSIIDISNRDKFIYWLYFAKIEDPMIIIQTDKGRLLLKFVEGKLFFVESL